MDASHEERDKPAATGGCGRDDQARASAYLDLWERHVWLTAVDGVRPWPGEAARPPARSTTRDRTHR